MRRHSLSWQLKLFMTGVLMIAHFMLPARAECSVIDAPHNESNGIACGTCHKYSIWWQFSPMDSHSEGTAKKNALCLGCHGEEGPEIQVGNHAYDVMGSAHRDELGPWSRACVNCHDPHLQAQLDWQGTVANSGLYLVEGQLAAGTLQVSGLGTEESPYSSTFVYSDLVINAEGWENSITPWTAKTSAGRGLILTMTTNDPTATFEIINVDEGQAKITVLGQIDSSYDDGAAFGLLYGQLIRNKISVGGSDSDVQFFNNKGGFVDLTNNQGVCQVCHTQTLHFRNTGEVNVGEAIFDHTGQESGNCIFCHSHTKGLAFAGSELVHDHRSEGGAGCITCHDEDKVEMTPAEIDDLHGTCGRCHSFQGSDDILKSTVEATIALGRSGTDVTCVNCHGTGHVSSDVHDHRVISGLDPDCSGCHDLTTNDVLDQSKWDALHNNGDCALCHSYPGGDLNKDTVAEVIALGRTGEDINCSNCHGSVGHDTNVVHNNRVLTGLDPDCSGCHDLTTDSVVDQGKWDALHNNGQCTFCHSYESGTLDAELVAAVILAGKSKGGDSAQNCQSCHTTSAKFFHHMRPEYAAGTCDSCHDADDSATLHNKRSAGQTFCVGCHDVNNAAEIDTLHTACVTCHGYGGSNPNISEIAVRNTIAAGIAGTAVDCSNCHGVGHITSIAHNNRVLTDLDPDCGVCHDILTDTVVNHSKVDGLHNEGDCALCHSYAGGKLDPATVAAVILAGKSDGGNTAQNCQQCHTVEAQTFHHEHPKYAENNCTFCHVSTVTHDKRSADGTICGTCHTVATAAEIDATHTGGCIMCHAYDGSNPEIALSDVTSTITAGIGGTDVNCINCHGSETAVQNQHHSTSYYLEGNCDYCHADPRSTWNAATPGDLEGDALRPTQLGCRGCHVTIYNNNIQVSRIEYSDNSTNPDVYDYTIPPTKTLVHDLPGNMARGVDNYGICLSCHDGSGDAPAVSLYHARPPLSFQQKESCRTLEFAPGHTTFNRSAEYFYQRNADNKNVAKPLCFGTGWSSAYHNGAAPGYEGSISVPYGPFNGGSESIVNIDAPVFPALGETPVGGYEGRSYDDPTRVLQVPVPYATISLAIDAAFDGDVIEVADGTYTEVLEIENEDKSITIRSINGPAVTIIDAIGINTGALRVTNSNSITIEGFTITNSDPVDSNKVMAIASYGSFLTVDNCIITDNYGNGTSAIYFSGGAGDHFTLTNSTISNNSGGSPAVYISGAGATATISDTNFTDNTPRASDGSGGGALYVSTGTVVTVSDSLFAGNVKSGSGGAIYNNAGNVTINNSVFTNSTTTLHGGAIYSGSSGSNTYITNCMITGNSAAGSGGGVYAAAFNKTYIYNSTIAGNSAAIGGGGVYEYTSLTNVYVYNSIIRGNYAPTNPQVLGPTVTYTNLEGAVAGTGNIDLDPLFVDPRSYTEAPTTGGDYHIGAGSPCIDTANPAVAPATDFEGDPRPSGLGVDMGADEYTTP